MGAGATPARDSRDGRVVSTQWKAPPCESDARRHLMLLEHQQPKDLDVSKLGCVAELNMSFLVKPLQDWRREDLGKSVSLNRRMCALLCGTFLWPIRSGSCEPRRCRKSLSLNAMERHQHGPVRLGRPHISSFESCSPSALALVQATCQMRRSSVEQRSHKTRGIAYFRSSLSSLNQTRDGPFVLVKFS